MRKLAWLVLALAAACGKEERPATPAPAVQAPYLVDAAWLRDHRDEVVLVDMQSTKDLYEKGHIQGARHIEVDDLRGPDKNLLPEAELAQRLGALGIDENTHVVVYDEKNGRNAGWMWFALDQLGHGAVSLLDGNMAPFAGELEAGPGPRFEARTYHPRHAPRDIVDTGWVQENLGTAVFLDARPPEQYTGAKPKEGMKGGHLPGAINVPWDAFVGPDGRYLSVEEARARLAQFVNGEPFRGATLVPYCNSYHQAAHLHFQLRRLGYDRIKAYDGSMKAWEKAGLPEKKGEQP